jgi:hypothetical protein
LRRTLGRTVEPVPGPAEPRDDHPGKHDADRDGGVVQSLRVDCDVPTPESAGARRGRTEAEAAQTNLG